MRVFTKRYLVRIRMVERVCVCAVISWSESVFFHLNCDFLLVFISNATKCNSINFLTQKHPYSYPTPAKIQQNTSVHRLRCKNSETTEKNSVHIKRKETSNLKLWQHAKSRFYEFSSFFVFSLVFLNWLTSNELSNMNGSD